VIDNKINDIKLGIYNMKRELNKFEKKYLISSEEFYEKFEAGEFRDEDDFMLWSGIYEMYLRELQELKQIEC